jgi:hypothetical protein
LRWCATRCPRAMNEVCQMRFTLTSSRSYSEPTKYQSARMSLNLIRKPSSKSRSPNQSHEPRRVAGKFMGRNDHLESDRRSPLRPFKRRPHPVGQTPSPPFPRVPLITRRAAAAIRRSSIRPFARGPCRGPSPSCRYDGAPQNSRLMVSFRPGAGRSGVGRITKDEARWLESGKREMPVSTRDAAGGFAAESVPMKTQAPQGTLARSEPGLG